MPAKKTPPPVSADPVDDSLIPYYSHSIRARLAHHELTDEFVGRLLNVTGGGLKEEQGGNWERVRLANGFLRQHESKGLKKGRDRLVNKVNRLPRDRRQLLDTHSKVAGIGFHYTSPALTFGEVAYLSRACDWIEVANLDDVIECISTAFPGAEVIELPASEEAPPPGLALVPPAGADGEGMEQPSPSATSKKKPKLVIDGDVQVPDGYTDQAISLEGTTAEIKARINTVLHATFVAEVTGKNRAGIVDWLMKAKLKGFKVPAEWRTVDEGET